MECYWTLIKPKVVRLRRNAFPHPFVKADTHSIDQWSGPSCSELAPCPYLYAFCNPGQVLEITSEGMSEFYSESVEKKSAVLMKMFANTLI